MRSPAWAVGIVVVALATGTSAGAIPAPTASDVAPSVAGTWKGPFLGYTFTFEFQRTATGWTGRYQSDKANKWADVQVVGVADGTIRFTVVSTPPSLYTLKVDPTGKSMTGSVQIGQFPTMPLNLTRVS